MLGIYAIVSLVVTGIAGLGIYIFFGMINTLGVFTVWASCIALLILYCSGLYYGWSTFIRNNKQEQRGN